MLSHFFVLTLGIAFLFIGAEVLVECSVKIATILKIRPFIIGVTVISFASSVPELCIGLTSLYRHQAEIMLGNVIGSNIANLALLIGVAALIRPLSTKQTVLNRDIVIMFIATVLFLIFIHDSHISRWEGALLFSGILLYNLMLIDSAKIKRSKSLSNMGVARYVIKESFNNKLIYFFLIGGLVGLIYGAHLIVKSAIDLADYFGINKLIISMSMVSVATALPELGMAIVSSIKKQTDLLLGNIIGSNIYNLFFVAGFSTFIFPVQLTGQKLYFQLAALLLFSLVVIPFTRPNFTFGRLRAILLLIIYIVFISLLYL